MSYHTNLGCEASKSVHEIQEQTQKRFTVHDLKKFKKQLPNMPEIPKSEANLDVSSFCE